MRHKNKLLKLENQVAERRKKMERRMKNDRAKLEEAELELLEKLTHAHNYSSNAIETYDANDDMVAMTSLTPKESEPRGLGKPASSRRR